jgi:hypothetical protein
MNWSARDVGLEDLDRIGAEMVLEPGHVTRMKADLQKLHFKGILVERDAAIGGVLFYYHAYSTWEARCLYIAKIWVQQDDSRQFKSLVAALIDRGRQLNVSRINYNSKVSDPLNKYLSDMFIDLYGAKDLTNQEKWLIFRMDLRMMTEFSVNHRSHIQFENNRFTIEKAIVEHDGEAICGLIKELAEFELMPDQFKLTKNDLIRDSSSPINFYNCLVVRNSGENNTIVAFLLYYYSYDVAVGRGCYLDDLYVRMDHRNKNIGERGSFSWLCC